MKQHKPFFRSGRRNFFKKAALVGTAGIAGVFSRSFARPVRPNQAPTRMTARGYRPTPHIRKYYERAAL